MAAAGSAQTTVTLTGTGFVASSLVEWNGTALTSSDTSATTLSATIPASDLATAGTAQLTVTNAAPGGGTSEAQTFTIANPAPTLSAISPASAPEGSLALSLSLTGTGFIPSSVIQWNGSPLATTYASAISLTAMVPAALLGAAGAAQVTVVNAVPGGGASAAQTFTVTAITKIGAYSVNATDFTWDAVHNQFYLSLPSTAPNGDSVMALNPLAGSFGTPVNLGAEPNLLAVSATGQYLYAGMTGSIERLNLPGLTPDVAISIDANYNHEPQFPVDLEASPAADQTFAVILGPFNGVSIYDDTVARLHTLCGESGFPVLSGCLEPVPTPYSTLQWSPDASLIYITDSYDEGNVLYVDQVDSTGFIGVTLYPGDFPDGADSRIHYDATTKLLYGDDGRVIDPATGALIGTFPANGPMTPDGANGLAYFLGPILNGTESITSYDIQHFTPVNTYLVPNVTGNYVRQLTRWGVHGLAFLTNDVNLGGTGTLNPQSDDALHVIYDPTFVGNTNAASQQDGGAAPSLR